jgi:hypothetical protein
MMLLCHTSRIPSTPTLLLHRSRHLDLSLLTLELGVAKPILVDHSGNEIDCKTPDIKGIDERNDPFHYRSPIVFFSVAQDAKGNRETELNQDEDELDPEGDSEMAVFAVVHS